MQLKTTTTMTAFSAVNRIYGNNTVIVRDVLLAVISTRNGAVKRRACVRDSILRFFFLLRRNGNSIFGESDAAQLGTDRTNGRSSSCFISRRRDRTPSVGLPFLAEA